MKTLEEAAKAYCALREEIDALSRQAAALGDCDPVFDLSSVLAPYYYEPIPLDDSNFSEEPGYVDHCVELIRRWCQQDDDIKVLWYDIKDEAAVCAVCRERIRIWTARRALRRRLGARMRTMRQAFRALVVAPLPPLQPGHTDPVDDCPLC